MAETLMVRTEGAVTGKRHESEAFTLITTSITLFRFGNTLKNEYFRNVRTVTESTLVPPHMVDERHETVRDVMGADLNDLPWADPFVFGHSSVRAARLGCFQHHTRVVLSGGSSSTSNDLVTTRMIRSTISLRHTMWDNARLLSAPDWLIRTNNTAACFLKWHMLKACLSEGVTWQRDSRKCTYAGQQREVILSVRGAM